MSTGNWSPVKCWGVSRGSAKRVDLLIGTNRDEAMFFAMGQPVLSLLPPTANPFFPSDMLSQQAAMILTYGRDLPAVGLLPGRQGATIAMVSDQLLRIPAIRLAEAQRKWNNKTYMYRFDWGPRAPAVSPPDKDVGAMHTLELPFVFGTLRLGWVPFAAGADAHEVAERRHLANQMMDWWLAFARTGSPNPRPASGTPGDRTTSKPLHDAVGRQAPLVRSPDEARRQAWEPYSFANFDYELPIG